MKEGGRRVEKREGGRKAESTQRRKQEMRWKEEKIKGGRGRRGYVEEGEKMHKRGNRYFEALQKQD